VCNSSLNSSEVRYSGGVLWSRRNWKRRQRKKETYHPIDPSQALEVVLGQLAEADLAEEILLPAFDAAVDADGDIPLLADDAAEAALLVARGDVGEGVGQVVELAAVEELRGHVVLEPQDLGDLHLDGHLAADVAQQAVAGGIDAVGLGDGAVVQPEDDVAVRVEGGRGDGDGLVGVAGEDGQRAGRVEADAADVRGVDVVLAEGALHGDADAAPDVGGRLFLSS